MTFKILSVKRYACIEEVYGIDDAETYMHISSWDIVYPIDTGWFDRNEFFEEHLILLDLVLK
jgi:hypothetical protein